MKTRLNKFHIDYQNEREGEEVTGLPYVVRNIYTQLTHLGAHEVCDTYVQYNHPIIITITITITITTPSSDYHHHTHVQYMHPIQALSQHQLAQDSASTHLQKSTSK